MSLLLRNVQCTNRVSCIVAPPQQSPEEIRAMEAEATFTVQQVAATAVMLYLCKSTSTVL